MGGKKNDNFLHTPVAGLLLVVELALYRSLRYCAMVDLAEPSHLVKVCRSGSCSGIPIICGRAQTGVYLRLLCAHTHSCLPLIVFAERETLGKFLCLSFA